MAKSKGKQEAATAGSISVPTVFRLNIVAQVASILFEPFRAPGPEADAADRRAAANMPHLETVLGHPSHLRIGRKRLGGQAQDLRRPSVLDRGIHIRDSFGSSGILCGQIVIER